MQDKSVIDGEQGGLTAKQERFVKEYLIDLNATAAYQRAGYKAASGRSAENAASRLLGNVGVQRAIQAGQQTKIARLQLTVDQVIDEVRNLAYSDIGDILDFTGEQPKMKPANQITPAARRCIASFKTKRYVEGKGDDATVVEITEFRLWDKVAALAKLCAHLGIGADNDPNDNEVDIVQVNVILHGVTLPTTPGGHPCPPAHLPAIEPTKQGAQNGIL
jgi:phage terminase small subunit